MRITDVILDFDGTCTQIPAIYNQFLAQYLQELNKLAFAGNPISKQEWHDVKRLVHEHSPQAGWTIATTPAAPAAADPYILAYESVMLLTRLRKKKTDVPQAVFQNASALWPAPWRNEARPVFEALLKRNINITFISNSDTTIITARLLGLFGLGKDAPLPQGIKVQSTAEKYKITELPADSEIPKENIKRFQAIHPVVHPDMGIGRPVYLRRAAYFQAIGKAFGNDLTRLKTAVFCGDIWEMDLAMPAALGAHVHLIERAKPFDTYDYERKAVLAAKGRISDDLNGLIRWME